MKCMSRFELAIFALVWLAAIGGLACLATGAEPPAITATANGQQLILTPTLPAGSGAMWRVTAGTKAGTWNLILCTAAGSQPAMFDGGLVLSFGTSPVPPPVPPVPPAPIIKPVAVYLIYANADITPKTAAVRDGQPWKKAAESLGIQWFCFDDVDGATAFKNATQRAIAVGLPAVVFLTAKGVPDVVKMPGTAAEMEALVKAKGGVK